MTSTSVKKAIKIYARLKPSDASICQYEIDKHINDDGTTDDILVMNASTDEFYANSNNSSVSRPDAYKFRFTKVFDGHISQEEIFDEMCRPVLESALQGYNSTIFAYGQTGSGKTYSMTGSRQQWRNRGIIPRSLSYIFEKFNEMTNEGYIASAFLSYLEIYNENGYDLLHTGFSSGRIEDLKKVQLLEDSQQQIHMKNLTVHPIKSEDEAMQLLYLGDHNRIIAETPMNEASTRSHCIFTIHLNIREGNSSTVRRSKVHLVDLAGSERLANSNSTGQLFHEARHINLALHYLEQVIVALGESNRSHIPYRNSMMTSILRDSLGGNCMTTMVATLSLEHRNIMETLSTCRFSQRVALVTNAAMLNEETDPMLLIAQLKQENKRLKDIITNSSIKNLDSSSGPLTQEEVSDCWKLVEKFIADTDEEAILPIPPDMRMVQTCFRCLKMAVQMNKEELAAISPDLAAHHFSSTPPAVQKHCPYDEDMSREQLLECLRTRDAEVEVLSKMLRPQNQNLSKNAPSFHSASSGNLTEPKMEQCRDDPLQQCPSDFEDDNPPPNDGGLSRPVKVHSRINNNQSEKEDQASAGASSFNPQANSDEFNIFDSMFVEGFSESKRKALDAFIKSYKSFEKLKNIQESLSSKKSEVESIENLLRRNTANLNNLKVVMMSSEGAGEDEDLFMKEAVDSQTLSIQKQERQFNKSREELKQIEGNLKGLYAQLMCDFEKHWQTMKDFNRRAGIPVEIDFTEALQQQQEDKPVIEVTKGIVKGVGGSLTNQNTGKSRGGSRGGQHANSAEFFISTAPPQAKPPPRLMHTSKSSNSPGRTNKGKQVPQNSPRDPVAVQDGKKSPKKTTLHANKNSKVPPTTPALNMAPSQTPIELLHYHQHNAFPSEHSTENFIGYYSPPQNYNNNNTTSNPAATSPSTFNVKNSSPKPTPNNQFVPAPPLGKYYDGKGDEDDDELLKDLPMTGDATIDQEILAFFKTRQAVFKQMNSDKSGNIGKGGEEDDVGAQAQSFYKYHQPHVQKSGHRGDTTLF